MFQDIHTFVPGNKCVCMCTLTHVNEGNEKIVETVVDAHLFQAFLFRTVCCFEISRAGRDGPLRLPTNQED